jgi:hypothetical protein
MRSKANTKEGGGGRKGEDKGDHLYKMIKEVE